MRAPLIDTDARQPRRLPRHRVPFPTPSQGTPLPSFMVRASIGPTVTAMAPQCAYGSAHLPFITRPLLTGPIRRTSIAMSPRSWLCQPHRPPFMLKEAQSLSRLRRPKQVTGTGATAAPPITPKPLIVRRAGCAWPHSLPLLNRFLLSFSFRSYSWIRLLYRHLLGRGAGSR
jgi:hypothetical protein